RNNYLYGVPMQVGYSAPSNEDCEVRDNVIVNAGLSINKYKKAVNEGNLVLAKGAPRPKGVRTVLRPNKYDPNRANLALFNWEKIPAPEVFAPVTLELYRVKRQGVVVFGWRVGASRPSVAEEMEELAEALSQEFGTAVAVHYDDQVGLREALLSRDGEPVRYFG